jgi:hypothetical protein
MHRYKFFGRINGGKRITKKVRWRGSNNDFVIITTEEVDGITDYMFRCSGINVSS